MSTFNMPAELAEIIAIHRREFGGFVMEELPNQSEPSAGDNAGDSGKQDQGADGFKSEHSKQSVLADLATARQERNELRAKVEKLEPLAAQLEKLTKARAPEPNDGDGEQATVDTLAAIQKRLDEADLRASVEALARKHKIDSDEDVALLASISDAKQREALAARIAPGDQGNKKNWPPRPDPSIGKGGGAGSPRTVAEARKEALARRTQTK